MDFLHSDDNASSSTWSNNTSSTNNQTKSCDKSETQVIASNQKIISKNPEIELINVSSSSELSIHNSAVKTELEDTSQLENLSGNLSGFNSINNSSDDNSMEENNNDPNNNLDIIEESYSAQNISNELDPRPGCSKDFGQQDLSNPSKTERLAEYNFNSSDSDGITGNQTLELNSRCYPNTDSSVSGTSPSDCEMHDFVEDSMSGVSLDTNVRSSVNSGDDLAQSQHSTSSDDCFEDSNNIFTYEQSDYYSPEVDSNKLENECNHDVPQDNNKQQSTQPENSTQCKQTPQTVPEDVEMDDMEDKAEILIIPNKDVPEEPYIMIEKDISEEQLKSPTEDTWQKDIDSIKHIFPNEDEYIIHNVYQNYKHYANRVILTVWDLMPDKRPSPIICSKRKMEDNCPLSIKRSSGTSTKTLTQKNTVRASTSKEQFFTPETLEQSLDIIESSNGIPESIIEFPENVVEVPENELIKEVTSNKDFSDIIEISEVQITQPTSSQNMESQSTLKLIISPPKFIAPVSQLVKTKLLNDVSFHTKTVQNQNIVKATSFTSNPVIIKNFENEIEKKVKPILQKPKLLLSSASTGIVAKSIIPKRKKLIRKANLTLDQRDRVPVHAAGTSDILTHQTPKSTYVSSNYPGDCNAFVKKKSTNRLIIKDINQLMDKVMSQSELTQAILTENDGQSYMVKDSSLKMWMSNQNNSSNISVNTNTNMDKDSSTSVFSIDQNDDVFLESPLIQQGLIDYFQSLVKENHKISNDSVSHKNVESEVLQVQKVLQDSYKQITSLDNNNTFAASTSATSKPATITHEAASSHIAPFNQTAMQPVTSPSSTISNSIAMPTLVPFKESMINRKFVPNQTLSSTRTLNQSWTMTSKPIPMSREIMINKNTFFDSTLKSVVITRESTEHRIAPSHVISKPATITSTEAHNSGQSKFQIPPIRMSQSLPSISRIATGHTNKIAVTPTSINRQVQVMYDDGYIHMVKHQKQHSIIPENANIIPRSSDKVAALQSRPHRNCLCLNCASLSKSVIHARTTSTMPCSKITDLNRRNTPPNELIILDSSDPEENIEDIMKNLGNLNQEIKSLPDSTIYYNLVNMFTNTKREYILALCKQYAYKGDKDKLMPNLVDHLLVNNDKYPRIEEVFEPDPVDFNLEEQYDNLLAIFPDADPNFLRHNAEAFYNSPDDLENFVQVNLREKKYPTREKYLQQLKLKEQIKQYTTNFDVKQFLEIFSDPCKYFEDPRRQSNERLSLEFLKYKYNRIKLETITKTFRKYKNLSLVVNDLDNIKVDMRSKRNTMEPLPSDNIPFLQEVAFVQHKEEILNYIDETKAQEEREFKMLKKRGMLLECQCCYNDECVPSKCFSCSNNHLFCSSCIVKGTEAKLADGETRVPCFMDCGTEFPLSVLQKVLKPTKFSILLRKIQEAEIMAAGVDGLVSCPFCHFASIPPPEDKVFKCLNPECMKESCRACKEPNHVPYKCEEVKSEKARHILEERMTEALLRTCYKCKKVFYKEEGCNKMTCTCGAKMCYLCGQAITDYGHFRGQGSNALNLCPLYTDDKRINAEVVRRVAERTAKEILEKNPHLKLDTDKLMPMVPKPANGPHTTIINVQQLPEHARRARPYTDDI